MVAAAAVVLTVIRRRLKIAPRTLKQVAQSGMHRARLKHRVESRQSRVKTQDEHDHKDYLISTGTATALLGTTGQVSTSNFVE